MAKKGKRKCDTLPVLHLDAAGIDVGASELYVAVSADRDPHGYGAGGCFQEMACDSPLPIAIFDTGAHNRLAKDPGDRDHIFAGIKSKYFFRLAGLSYEEMASTPDLAQPTAFLDDARRLKEGPWDCLNPANEVLRVSLRSLLPTELRRS
jgi:hypothetical protein